MLIRDDVLTTVILFLQLSICLTLAQELITYFPTKIFVSKNLKNGDEIVLDNPIRSLPKTKEDVALNLNPSSSGISIKPSILPPQGKIQLFVNDSEALANSPNKEFKIQAIGLITGRQYEQSFTVEFIDVKNNTQSSLLDANIFSDLHELTLSKAFRESENITLVHSANLPNSFDQINFSLVGPYSDRFKIFSTAHEVTASTVPCESAKICNSIPLNLSMALVAQNGDKFITKDINFVRDAFDLKRIGCAKPFYEATIEEGTENFNKLLKIDAKDGSNYQYSLQDPTGLFQIHPTKGVIYLSHAEFLTSENFGSTFNISVVMSAPVRGEASCEVVIHLEPSKRSEFSFEKDMYTFKIRSNESFIGKVKLTSEAQNVEFVISKGGEGKFEVDAEGWLFYKGEPLRETQEHDIQILAVKKEDDEWDNVASTKAHVMLHNVGSNPLQIISPSNFVVNLEEEDSNYPRVLSRIIVNDADEDANVEFELQPLEALHIEGGIVDFSEYSNKIILKKEGKEAKVFLTEDLHHLPYTTIFIAVKVSDTAHSDEPSSIVSGFVNILRNQKFNELPKTLLSFVETSEMITLPKDLKTNDKVYQIQTIGGSGNITFTLNDDSDFQINKRGDIVFTGESAPQVPIILNVTAKDENDVTEIMASLKFKPAEEGMTQFEMPFYEASIPADALPGTIIISLAVNNSTKSEPLLLSLQGDHAELFEIDQKGNIQVADSLEEVSDKKIGLLAAVEDGENSPAFVPVSILVQPSNKPLSFEMSKYSGMILDNTEEGSYILQAKILGAQSADYKLVAKNEIDNGLLKIDKSGKIRLDKAINAKIGPHKFTILANSGNKTASAPLDLNVKSSISCHPNVDIQNAKLQFDEHSPIGTEIGSVLMDKLAERCNGSFALWDSENQVMTSQFSGIQIDPKSGKMFVNEEFDYEQHPHLPVTVVINSGMQSEKFDVVISVNDIDDHPLRFEEKHLEIEVPRDSSAGQEIAVIKAVDEDKSQSIFYHLPESDAHPFSIDSRTGVLKLKKSLASEEESKRIIVQVYASNDPDPKLSTPISLQLTAIVTERNGHIPTFLQGAYEAVIPRNSMLGTHILSVRAVAPNLGPVTTPVHYSLGDTIFEYRGMSRPSDGIFTIDRDTGMIKLAKGLSYFAGGMFRIVVRASDKTEGTKRGSKAIVKVYIHENSDVVRIKLPVKPSEVSSKEINEVLDRIAMNSQLIPIPKEVRYHVVENLASPSIVDLHTIFLNKSSSEIVHADKVINILSKQSQKWSPPLKMMKPNEEQIMNVSDSSFPEILIVILVFLLLLLIIFVIFSLIICYYRSRFLREKRQFEDDRVLANTLNFPTNSLRPPRSPNLNHITSPVAIYGVIPSLRDKHQYQSSSKDKKNVASYAVQEARMTVGAGDATDKPSVDQ